MGISSEAINSLSRNSSLISAQQHAPFGYAACHWLLARLGLRHFLSFDMTCPPGCISRFSFQYARHTSARRHFIDIEALFDLRALSFGYKLAATSEEKAYRYFLH